MLKRSVLSFLTVLVYAFFAAGTTDSAPSGSGGTAPASSSKISDAECRKTLECWGERHSMDAAFKCKGPVERLAKNNFEWTDGILEPKFSHYRWKDQNAGVVTYIGDKIKFQNGFGAWIFHTYECDLDASGEVVLDVRARPGRLGQ